MFMAFQLQLVQVLVPVVTLVVVVMVRDEEIWAYSGQHSRC